MARFEVPDGRDAREYTWELTGAMGVRAKEFSGAVYDEGRLPLREFEAVRMRTAQINGCRLCMAYRTGQDHATRGVGEDVPAEAFYEAVESWRTAEIFTDRERNAIEFAERYLCDPDPLAGDDEFWQRMRATFSDVEIAEIAMSVSAFFLRGRFAHVMGVDDVCEILPAPRPEQLADSRG